MDVSAYIHFPWCLQKCPYCDFASSGIERAAIPSAAYSESVLREVELRRGTFEEHRLVSIFFGGGTPSLWEPAELGRVLCAVRAAFSSEAPDLEITVECNPTSLDRARARALRNEGVNRLSIGVQSLDEKRLRFLGRLHDAPMALRAVEDAQSEIARVSADLMFGMPEQTVLDWLGEIERIAQTGVEHISAYALTIEPGTQFGALHRKGKLPLARDVDYAEMFMKGREVLEAKGFVHYEVSNFAKPSQEARHNLHYWRGGAYLGLGAGAVGSLPVGATRQRRRYRNSGDFADYSRAMEASNLDQAEVHEENLSPEDLVREALMLGLRTRDGLDTRLLEDVVGTSIRKTRERALERRKKQGDVVDDGNSLRVPPSRWLHLDGIVADLF